MSLLYFGLDNVCLFKARAGAFNLVYISTAVSVFLGRDTNLTHMDLAMNKQPILSPKIQYNENISLLI
jgi:hypothetical protein